jgi:hypothetical protein
MLAKSAQSIETRIDRIKKQLIQIGEMRPGSLSQQYSACEKPGCKCIDPVNPQRHGPFYQLSYQHAGKSTTQFIRPQFVSTVRRQLANYKKFRALTQEWLGLALELAKLQMQQARLAEPRRTRASRPRSRLHSVSEPPAPGSATSETP